MIYLIELFRDSFQQNGSIFRYISVLINYVKGHFRNKNKKINLRVTKYFY